VSGKDAGLLSHIQPVQPFSPVDVAIVSDPAAAEWRPLSKNTMGRDSEKVFTDRSLSFNRGLLFGLYQRRYSCCTINMHKLYVNVEILYK
jgi:hypothetical protein